ncbi:calponin homology domain-containing protein [Pavlovales sp. CCMP2436]|nr:calponin homology domain-containing protein [Pavlovales sp. CCMP2436]
MTGDLHTLLRDGTVLAHLVNAIEPGSVGRALLKPATSKFGTLETIAAFLDAAREMGVGEHDLFTSKELYDGEGAVIEAVQRTILALARCTSRRADYEGPTLQLPATSYEDSIIIHRESILSANTARRSGVTAPAAKATPPAWRGSENAAPASQRADVQRFDNAPVRVMTSNY